MFFCLKSGDRTPVSYQVTGHQCPVVTGHQCPPIKTQFNHTQGEHFLRSALSDELTKFGSWPNASLLTQTIGRPSDA